MAMCPNHPTQEARYPVTEVNAEQHFYCVSCLCQNQTKHGPSHKESGYKLRMESAPWCPECAVCANDGYTEGAPVFPAIGKDGMPGYYCMQCLCATKDQHKALLHNGKSYVYRRATDNSQDMLLCADCCELIKQDRETAEHYAKDRRFPAPLYHCLLHPTQLRKERPKALGAAAGEYLCDICYEEDPFHEGISEDSFDPTAPRLPSAVQCCLFHPARIAAREFDHPDFFCQECLQNNARAPVASFKVYSEEGFPFQIKKLHLLAPITCLADGSDFKFELCAAPVIVTRAEYKDKQEEELKGFITFKRIQVRSEADVAVSFNFYLHLKFGQLELIQEMIEAYTEYEKTYGTKYAYPAFKVDRHWNKCLSTLPPNWYYSVKEAFLSYRHNAARNLTSASTEDRRLLDYWQYLLKELDGVNGQDEGFFIANGRVFMPPNLMALPDYKLVEEKQEEAKAGAPPVPVMQPVTPHDSKDHTPRKQLLPNIFFPPTPRMPAQAGGPEFSFNPAASRDGLKACPICTFLNRPQRNYCEMCNFHFMSQLPVLRRQSPRLMQAPRKIIGLLANEKHSCYFDSFLVAICASGENWYTRQIREAQFNPFAVLERAIQFDLIQIFNFIQRQNRPQAEARSLRNRLRTSLQTLNATRPGTLPVNFDSFEQLEPLDIVILFHRIFTFENSVSIGRRGEGVLADGQLDLRLDDSINRPISDLIISYVDVQEATHTNAQINLQNYMKKTVNNPLQADDLYNRDRVSPYVFRRETNTYLEAPFFYVHVVRVVEGNPDKLIAQVKPPDFLQMRNTRLELVSIILHIGEKTKHGHYICYFKHHQTGHWYYYNDQDVEVNQYVENYAALISSDEVLRNAVDYIYIESRDEVRGGYVAPAAAMPSSASGPASAFLHPEEDESKSSGAAPHAGAGGYHPEHPSSFAASSSPPPSAPSISPLALSASAAAHAGVGAHTVSLSAGPAQADEGALAKEAARKFAPLGSRLGQAIAVSKGLNKEILEVCKTLPGNKIAETLAIIIKHQQARFAELNLFLRVPGNTVVIAGNPLTSNHFLGTGLAIGQWKRLGIEGSLSGQVAAGLMLFFLEECIVSLRTDPAIRGILKFGKVGRYEYDPENKNAKRKPPPDSQEKILRTDADYIAPSASYLHVWGANAGNWNLADEEEISGGGQADCMGNQTLGVFGVVTTPVYGIDGLQNKPNTKHA